jgi:hypothetical protein
MFDEIKEKIGKGPLLLRIFGFIILCWVIYQGIWTIVEPLNIGYFNDHKTIWRIFLFTSTLLISTLLFLFFRWKQISDLIQNWYNKTRKGYFSNLEKNFDQMPFIYKGLNTVESLTITNDHVAASYGYYPLIQIASEQMPMYYGDDITEFKDRLQGCANSMLNKCSRILIFGHAGMGKTTFLQHAIFRIIGSNNKDSEFHSFNIEKGIIPIFVPLKILDYDNISPILKYIITIPFFNGKKGRERFKKLAEERKILLFLDGYDEIKIRNNVSNTIINELDILFSRSSFTNAENNPFFKELYTLLPSYNSIWLTSRLSYFFETPLKVLKDQKEISKNLDFYQQYNYNQTIELNSKTHVVGSVIINGVQEKSKLISKLISRHKAVNPGHFPDLTPDLVLRFIDKHFGNEADEIINSPLFITIFFFVYVNSYSDSTKTFNEKLTLKLAIEECTELILHDLDNEKVKDFNDTGIHLRMKYSSSTKKEFIKFFSYQFYISPKFQKKESFTKEDILLIAESFKDPNSSGIVSESDQFRVELVEEILSQNFFVMVTDMGESKFYDFPHRRFKEFFTIDFFNSGNNFTLLLKELKNPNFRDFIILFYLNSEKNNERIIEECINQISMFGMQDESHSILLECLSSKKEKLTSNLSDKLLSCIIFENKEQEISQEIINFCIVSNNILDIIENKLRNYIRTDDYLNTDRVINIYYALSPEKTKDFISHQIGLVSLKNRSIQKLCALLVSEFENSITFEILRRQFDNENFLSLLNYLAGITKFRTDSEVWQLFFKKLSSFQKDLFLNFIKAKLAENPILDIQNKALCKILIDKFSNDFSFRILQQSFLGINFIDLVKFLKTDNNFKNDNNIWLSFSKSLNSEQSEILKDAIIVKGRWPEIN